MRIGDVAMKAEIKVNLSTLNVKAKELSQLGENLSNRRVEIQFTHAKGDVADNLLAVAEQLNAMGDTLAILALNTYATLVYAKQKFIEADVKNANLWTQMEE